MDFTTPFIKWLLKCKYLKNNKLFLNAAKAENNNTQIVTQQINRDESKEYVDGSTLHKVVFTLFDYKSIQFAQLFNAMIDKNENVEKLLEVGAINDFISKMELKGDYPNFGDEYEVQRIYCKYLTPSSPTIDGNLSLAKYSIPIVCEVLELAK